MLFRADDIFLGSGGNSPGLDVLRTGEIQRLVDLPAGHSAYAIDLAPQGNALAIGTKTGFLYWLAPTADDAPLALPDPLFQALRFCRCVSLTACGWWSAMRRAAACAGKALMRPDRA